MNRLFKDVKNELARVAGQTGFKADDPRLKDRVNLAQERLLQEGNWPGVLERCRFCIYHGVIALPEKYDAVIGIALDKDPKPVADPWYEFLEHGPGVQVCGAADATKTYAIDQGESAVIRHPMGKKLKAFSESVQPITVYADGMTVTIDPGNATTEAVTTAFTYKHIERVELVAPDSELELVYEDADGKEFLGARYSGEFLRPSLRLFQVPGSRTGATADVLARKRFVPIVDDNSEMLIGNLPALRNMLISLFKEETGELELAEAYLQRAIASMRSENKRYFGSAEPQVNISSSVQAFGEIENIL